MSRVFTAGVAATHDATPARPDQAGIESMVWACLEELWGLGTTRTPIAAEYARVDGWIRRADAYVAKHPEVREIPANQDRYGRAMDRLMRLNAQLTSIDRQAASCVANLARHWDRLSVANRTRLQQGVDWSQEREGAAFAAAMWARAKDREWYLGAEPGFLWVLLLLGSLIGGCIA